MLLMGSIANSRNVEVWLFLQVYKKHRLYSWCGHVRSVPPTLVRNFLSIWGFFSYPFIDSKSCKKKIRGHIHVILAFGRWRQEDQVILDYSDFEATLGYMRPCLLKKPFIHFDVDFFSVARCSFSLLISFPVIKLFSG